MFVMCDDVVVCCDVAHMAAMHGDGENERFVLFCPEVLVSSE